MGFTQQQLEKIIKLLIEKVDNLEFDNAILRYDNENLKKQLEIKECQNG